MATVTHSRVRVQRWIAGWDRMLKGLERAIRALFAECLPDLRYAIRSFRGSIPFTVTVILTLALGISSSAVILSVVNAVLLRPLPFKNADRLVLVYERDLRKGIDRDRVSPANYSDWREQNDVFEQLAYSPLWPGSRSYNVRGPDGNQRLRGAVVSSTLFEILGVQPILGRNFLPEEDRDESRLSVILSYSLWQERFGGDRNVLGQFLTFDNLGIVHARIVGVMPPGFDFPQKSQLWINASVYAIPPPNSADRCCSWFEVIGLLKPGVKPQEASRKMTMLASRLANQYPGKVKPEVLVVPLKDELVGKVRLPLLVLLGAVGCLLLIGCANCASLLLSRAAARQKEVAIRAALGASRGRLVRQMLTESVLLGLAGGLLGSLFAYWGLRYVVRVTADVVPRLNEVQIDSFALMALVGLSLGSGLLFGLVPALQASKTDLNNTLREGGRSADAGGAGRNRANRALVVAEVAMGLVLLLGAGLLLQSFLRLTAVNPGFAADETLVATFDMSSSVFEGQSRQLFFQSLMQRLSELPGVKAVGGISAAPLSEQIGRGETFLIQGRAYTSQSDLPIAATFSTTPDYFRAMGISLRRGRHFTDSDNRESLAVAMINEAAAKRYWRGQDPVGARILVGNLEQCERNRKTGEPEWREVVGVVADVRGSGLDSEPRPEMYIPYWQWPWRGADLVLRASGDPSQFAEAIRREAASLNKQAILMRTRTMKEIVADSVARPRFQAALVTGFSLAALLLAALGIFGIMSYTVAQRRQEIGIRMALGASRGTILKMVLGKAIRLTGVGVALGLTAALALARIVSSLLFGVSPYDPLTLIGVSLLLIVVALIASLIPALRAVQVDPMTALRHD